MDTNLTLLSDSYFKYSIFGAKIAVLALSIPMNLITALVFIIKLKNDRLKESVDYLFIFSALSHLIAATTMIPAEIVFQISSPESFFITDDFRTVVVPAIRTLFATCSILAILAIACHRNVAICADPLNMSTSWPVKYSTNAILTSLLLSVILTSVITALEGLDLASFAKGTFALLISGSATGIIGVYIPCLKNLSQRKDSARGRSMVGHNARVRQVQQGMNPQIAYNASQVTLNTCQQSKSTIKSSSSQTLANHQIYSAQLSTRSQDPLPRRTKTFSERQSRQCIIKIAMIIGIVLISFIPGVVASILRIFLHLSEDRDQELLTKVVAILELLPTLNFLFYTFVEAKFNKNFRKTLKNIFRKIRGKLHRKINV